MSGMIPDLGVRKIDQGDGLPPVMGVGFSGNERNALANAISGGNVSASWTQIGAYFVDSTVSAATPLVPASGATHMILQTTSQGVYVTLDNSVPSATNGLLLTPEMGARMFPLQGFSPQVIEASASATIRGAWVN